MARQDDGERPEGQLTRVVTAAFAPEASSVRAARRFVAEAADLDAEQSADLELVASEVATNAVLHARTPFTVEVTREPTVVRVSVRDESPTMPVAKDHGVDAPTGRGLKILDALVARWGVDAAHPGKAVWFELDVDGAPPAGARPARGDAPSQTVGGGEGRDGRG